MTRQVPQTTIIGADHEFRVPVTERFSQLHETTTRPLYLLPGWIPVGTVTTIQWRGGGESKIIFRDVGHPHVGPAVRG